MVLNRTEYRRREEHLAKSRLTPPFFVDRIGENRNLMTKREFVTKSGDTFEWEETDEVRKAVEKLHDTIRELEKKNAPDYGVGK